MVFSDSQKACSGQIDRYQLRYFLTELPLSAKTKLRRFSATDTVTSQTVLLETLPGGFANSSQMLLRKTLARQGIRQYAKVSDWGLPVFMHEIWELDASAAKSTGLQSGDLLLIYDLDAVDSLSDLLQEGVPPLCHQVLFDNLPQLCQRLQAAHRQNQGHGCLQSRTLWITTEGKLGITDFAVGHLLKQLEEKIPENEIQEAAPEQDLQDLKNLAAELALKAGYLENSEFKAALAGIDSPESFLALLQNPPAAAKAAPGSKGEAPSAASKPLRWFNAVFLLALILLLLLSGFLFWQRQSKRIARGAAIETSAAPRPPSLLTRKIQPHLSACFAVRFTLDEALSNSGPLGLTMLGQLNRIELVFDDQAAQIFQQKSEKHFELLAEHRWGSSPAPGSTFQVLKTASTLAIYRNHNFIAGCSLEIQQWRQLKWQSDSEYAGAPTLAYQRIGSLYFADDFMHSDDALGEWEVQSGEWAVHSLQTPVRSANPFSFIGKKDGAEVTAGYWFWRNYRLSCAIRPLDSKYFGLRISRGNEQSSYTVLWQRETENASAGLLTLSRRSEDGEEVLAQCPLAYPVGQWIELAVVNNEGLLQVLVDQQQVILARDKNPLLGGKIALLSSGEEGTVFDDVQVVPAPALQLPPESGVGQESLLFVKNSAANPDRPDEFVHSLRLNQPELSNAQINLELSGGQLKNSTWEMALQHRGYWEVCLRLKDSGGGQASAEILSRNFDQEQVLSSQSWALDPKQEVHSFTFQTSGGEAFALCNGRSLVFSSELPKQDSGYAVIRQLTSSKDFFSWSRLSYSAPPALLPAVDKVAMFTHEVSMRSWNNPVLEWLPDGQQYWYQADFWQDLDLNMELAPLLKIQPESEWGLLLGNGEKNVAVRLLYRPQEQELIVEQPSGDGIVERRKFELPPERVALQKRADRLLVRANGQVLWNLPLPESLRGLCLAGRSGKGNSSDWANAVQTLAAGIQSYSFQEAPCDWTSAGGTWEVTNRWQCDPRWSFFSGTNLEGAACLWNKFQHGENVSIDFFVGPKMDTDRGKKYEYAGDYALVLGADGKDISSGYSFIFGGWDNRGSQIVRQNKVVCESSELKVTRSSQIHRSWFHLKARKNGNQLSFWIDGKLVGTYIDAAPLPGRCFALWTWKNSLMAAQFRISSDRRVPATQSSLNSSKTPKTPYD